MQVALVPLDDRPVNTTMVADVAAIAGATVVLPPRETLPRFREPGDPDALAAWLLRTSGSVDAAVVSLDMLGYGGLVASRTSHDTTRTVLDRVAVLERLHAEHPALPVGAINVFLRASDSDNASEEPDYWEHYGRLLHRLGGRVHQAWLDGLAEAPRPVDEPGVPHDVRADFARRRLRNHVVNLAGLDLAHAGTVSTLLLTADDTAPRSAGSAEQSLVDYWRTLLGPHDEVLVYPGADEVGAVMTARLLSRHHGVSPSFAITCVEADGLERVAPYENSPLGSGVARQVRAAGGRVVDASPDVRLLVHAPAPSGGDYYGRRPEPTDPSLVAATVAEAARWLDAGDQVAVADCRFPNGSDPALVEGLREAGLLLRLVAYGGWNTAGNTVGSVVAAAATAVVGRETGTLDADACERFLLHRLVEDYGYQSRVRAELTTAPGHEHAFDTEGIGRTAERARAGLDEVLAELVGDGTWEVRNVRFPWSRAFEVDFRLHRTSRTPR